MEDYEEKLKRFSMLELVDAINNIDREKFPERYAQAQKRYEEIKNDPAFLKDYQAAKYHTGWSRFGAMWLDGVILSAGAWLAYFGLRPYVGGMPFSNDSIQNFLDPAYTIWLTYAFGQTLGKRICGVRVVSYPDEGKINFKSALLREIFPVASALVYVPLISFSTKNTTLGMIRDGIVETLNIGAFAWVLLEIVTMLSNEKRRALHDKIAGTVVIKV